MLEEKRLVEISEETPPEDQEIVCKKIKASTDKEAEKKADRAIARAERIFTNISYPKLIIVPIFLVQWKRLVKNYPLPKDVVSKTDLADMPINSAQN